MSDYTDALRRELGYYEKQGKDARADEVRAELARAERADAAAARAEEAAKPDVEEPAAPAKATGRSLRRGKETAVAAPAETTAETGAGEEPQPEPETDEA